MYNYTYGLFIKWAKEHRLDDLEDPQNPNKCSKSAIMNLLDEATNLVYEWIDIENCSDIFIYDTVDVDDITDIVYYDFVITHAIYTLAYDLLNDRYNTEDLPTQFERNAYFYLRNKGYVCF